MQGIEYIQNLLGNGIHAIDVREHPAGGAFVVLEHVIGGNALYAIEKYNKENGFFDKQPFFLLEDAAEAFFKETAKRPRHESPAGKKYIVSYAVDGRVDGIVYAKDLKDAMETARDEAQTIAFDGLEDNGEDWNGMPVPVHIENWDNPDESADF